MNYFIYNDLKSSDYEIYFEELPTLPISYNTDGYINFIVGMKNDINVIKELRDKLSNTKGSLRFSYDDRIWQVENLIVTELARNKDFIKINLEFFVNKYSLTDDPEIIYTNEKKLTIYNKYNVTTLPRFVIYGEGDISIIINQKIINIINVKNKVIIDSFIEECFDDIGLRNRDMIGDFPYLMPGENKISISSTKSFDNLIVIPRWRC